MFRLDPHPPSQSPARLLRPWAVLERLRPAKLVAFHLRLREYERLSLGLNLLQHHFPAALVDYDDLSGKGWWECLAHLANLVEEAGWFEINWPVLNEAWSYWMNEPDEEQGDHLAVFLHYLPVVLYGFTDGESLFEFPPIELLHTLLARCEIQAVSSQLLVETELYDNLEQWDETDRDSAWKLLEQIEADPGRYAEPVRWLPELARWACHRTGNVMLDQHFDPYGDGPWLTWRESDLLQIKTAWRRARPVIDVFHRLMHWYETDTSNLMKLADFLMNGGNCNELDW